MHLVPSTTRPLPLTRLEIRQSNQLQPKYDYSTTLSFGMLPFVEIEHVTRWCLFSANAYQRIVPVFGNYHSKFGVVQYKNMMCDRFPRKFHVQTSYKPSNKVLGLIFVVNIKFPLATYHTTLPSTEELYCLDRRKVDLVNGFFARLGHMVQNAS